MRSPARRGPAGVLRRLTVLLPAPALALVAAVFLVPIGLLMYLSVTDPTPGLHNYTAIASDGVSITVLLRTLRMAAIVTLATVLLSYPYAYVMTLAKPRMRTVMFAIVLMPFWTSLMARTFAWVVLLQNDGPLDKLLGFFGLASGGLLGTSTGVTIAMTQVLLPFMALPLYASLRGIDRRLTQAALGLGARPVVAFLRVYFPLSLPGIAAGAALVFILALGFYVTPALLGSPQESMVSQLMASRIQELVQFGAGGALGTIVLVVTLVLLALVSRLARRSSALSNGMGNK
ncbi:MAG TPA: ABC transporter permease [Mycobacteriales bacterium]